MVGRGGKIEIRAILIEFRAILHPKFEANLCKVDRTSTNCGRPRGQDRNLSNFDRVQKARIEPERESEHDFEGSASFLMLDIRRTYCYALL